MMFPTKRWLVAKLFLSKKLEDMIDPPTEQDMEKYKSIKNIDYSSSIGDACWVKTTKGEWIKGIYFYDLRYVYKDSECDLILDPEDVYIIK